MFHLRDFSIGIHISVSLATIHFNSSQDLEMTQFWSVKFKASARNIPISGTDNKCNSLFRSADCN